jgi:hypothetical protein
MIIIFLLIKSKADISDRRIIFNDISEITSSLKLTDLTLFSDARYTRHPSQADLFSAFQDGPGYIDHFPSGSVTPPPDFSSLGTAIEIRRR